MRFSCAVPCGPKMVPFHVRMYCAPAGAAPQPKRPGRPTEASPETACDSRLPRARPASRAPPMRRPCRSALQAAAVRRSVLQAAAAARSNAARRRRAHQVVGVVQAVRHGAVADALFPLL